MIYLENDLLETLIANEHRDVQKFTHQGQTLSLKRWAKVLDIPYSTLRRRKADGWSEDEMFLTKRNQHRKSKRLNVGRMVGGSFVMN
jgi:hypothetical protein